MGAKKLTKKDREKKTYNETTRQTDKYIHTMKVGWTEK